MALQTIVPQSAASTSSSSSKPCYDVFINHRGPDVKHKLASSIYQMLDLVGVRAFLDQDELELGDSISEAIKEAIQSASVHIAIFSPRYAESAWCLDELLLMLQTKVPIIPVFYNVQPFELRHVDKGKGKYADALFQHEIKGRYSLEKIKDWRDALIRVSDLSGCIVDAEKCDEGKLLREIVTATVDKMEKVPLGFARALVGLDEAVQDFESKSESSTGSENVHFVGIVGMGGAGKTTLAKELYNRKRSSFRRSSFLCNVRDAASKNTLHNLQQNLLKDFGIEHSTFHNLHQGMGILVKELRSLTLLIVLDDVDHVDQMDALLPDGVMHNLGPGSLIIVTTRHMDILKSLGMSSIYHMKPLDPNKAKQLFCRHAFFKPHSQPGFEHLLDNYPNFEDLIERFVKACNGLPLSLKVLGAMVNGRSQAYWKGELLKISRILPTDIFQSLKLSYDALDGEVQQMFLDVACFFIGAKQHTVVAVWDGSGWSGEVGWQTLVDKCLVGVDKVDDNHCINMHDHLRDLGRQIAGDVSPSRIWKEEQLTSIEGGRTLIRGILLGSWLFGYYMSGSNPAIGHFMEKIMKTEPMPAVQLLAVRGDEFGEEFEPLSKDLVWLRWDDFKGTNLPSWLSLKNLSVLKISATGNLEELWQDDVQPSLQLRELSIDLGWATGLFRLPRSIGRLRHLRRIELNGVDNRMVILPEEFCDLESLEVLLLSNIPVSSSLSDEFGKFRNLRTHELEFIHVEDCSQLKELPDLTTRFRKPPNNIGQLTKLEVLWIEIKPGNPEKSESLSEDFGRMSNLQHLDMKGTRFVDLGLGMGSPSGCNLKSLKSLILRETRVCRISISDDCCPTLERLQLWSNKYLTEIETLPGNVTEIVVEGCEKLKNMRGIGGLLKLQKLVVWNCRALEVLPYPAYMHSIGHELGIRNCPKVERRKRKIVEVLSKEKHNKESSKGKQKIEEPEEESDGSEEEVEEPEWSTENEE